MANNTILNEIAIVLRVCDFSEINQTLSVNKSAKIIEDYIIIDRLNDSDPISVKILLEGQWTIVKPNR